MIKTNFKPTVKVLKQFSILWFPLFFLFVGYISAEKLFDWELIKLCWIVLSVISVIGFKFPSLIRPIYIGLLIITFPIGWIVSHFLLFLIFVLLITPIGLILRVRGHDPLHLNKKGICSMWMKNEKPYNPSDYLKQY